MTNISAIRHAAMLKDIASSAEPPAPAQSLAVLSALNGRDARIEREGHVREARVAFGCIVRPEPGDHVLTSVAGGTIWVISVLERSSGTPMRLWAEGDVSLASARGNVSLTAARSIDLDAGERTRVAAPEIDLHAGMARFVLDELVQVGRRASLHIGKIRHIGDMIETFADHVLTRARRSSRFIEESDQVRAGDIDHRAENTLQMRAKTMFMTADTVVRVDADQIHMG